MIRRRSVSAMTISLSVILCNIGCSAVPELPNMIDGDWSSPILTGVFARSPAVVALEFDETVELKRAFITPDREIVSSQWREGELHLHTDSELKPGAEYWIDAVVADESGNISSIVVSVYGLNEELPPVLINEFVCEGSGTRPDWVELRVLAAGNLGGLTLYEGSPGTWDSRFVFPDVSVEADDYVIVHFKPEAIPEEIDETERRDESGGRDSHPEAWDFWVEGGDGIPNSTGALSITPYPDGPIVDAVLYTTRRYDPDSPLRGFGLASQVDMFEEVVEAGAWEIDGAEVIPEDGIDPKDSTATRSLNRNNDGRDTDTALDWHIGPTSSASPGYTNTDETYQR